MKPTPAEIKAARLARGLTQKAAAELIGSIRESWARYEAEGQNNRPMSPELWALWLHQAGIKRLPFPKKTGRVSQRPKRGN